MKNLKEIKMGNLEYHKKRMIQKHLTERGIYCQNVLDVIRKVEREKFIPKSDYFHAYDDNPLSIGYKQTISQPYIVALMTQLCELNNSDRVLEIGTGSGYQTAILSALSKEVYSLERIPALFNKANKHLVSYTNVKLYLQNGFNGLKEEAPFDVIILTACPVKIPSELITQLADNGRLIAPLGDSVQQLIRIKRNGDILHREEICYVSFVPMINSD